MSEATDEQLANQLRAAASELRDAKKQLKARGYTVNMTTKVPTISKTITETKEL